VVVEAAAVVSDGEPTMRTASRAPLLLSLALVASVAVPLRAQAPPGEPPAEEAASAAEQDAGKIDEILEGEEAVLAGEAYSYDPAGRRDPFVSLLARNEMERDGQPRPEGVPGLLIDELSIQGIFELNGRMLAQVQTADKDKSYLIQEGDQLYDGEVVSITDNEIVFKQVVNDPSVIKPFREVVKKLNPEP
jgi:Tfp pilus assembly protein PilP